MPDSDQSYDKDSVNLWVESEQKERWEAYLEDQGDLQLVTPPRNVNLGVADVDGDNAR